MLEETTQATAAETTAATSATATSPAGVSNSEKPAEPMIPKSRFDEVNNKVKALEAEKEAAVTEAQAAKEKQMAEQQQWRELAEERGKSMEGFKAKAAEYDKLAPIVAKQLKAEIDAWPEKVKGLFPTSEMPVNEMLEWAERFRPLAQEMMGDKTPTPGNGARPKPAGAAGAAKAEEQRAAWQQGARQRYR